VNIIKQYLASFILNFINDIAAAVVLVSHQLHAR